MNDFKVGDLVVIDREVLAFVDHNHASLIAKEFENKQYMIVSLVSEDFLEMVNSPLWFPKRWMKHFDYLDIL